MCAKHEKKPSYGRHYQKIVIVFAIKKSMQQCMDRRNDNEEFTLNKICTAEELSVFENALASDDDFQNMKKEIHASVHRLNVENRLHGTLDLVFDRKFVPEYSWKGLSRPSVRK